MYKRLHTPSLNRARASAVTVIQVDPDTGEVITTVTIPPYDLDQVRAVRSGKPVPERTRRRRTERRKR